MTERTAELRESEARYRSLTELASDWYWEQDEKGTFTKVSGPVLEMLGIQVPALAGDVGVAYSGGWNEAERDALRATIAARQPFLDFVFTRRRRRAAQLPGQRRTDDQQRLPLHWLSRRRRGIADQAINPCVAQPK